MSKRKRWQSHEKSEIVLQGLQGRPVSDICVEYDISASLYYKWKDQFLRNMHLAYEVSGYDKSLNGLKLENRKLKSVVAELTLELKKSDW